MLAPSEELCVSGFLRANFQEARGWEGGRWVLGEEVCQPKQSAKPKPTLGLIT